MKRQGLLSNMPLLDTLIGDIYSVFSSDLGKDKIKDLSNNLAELIQSRLSKQTSHAKGKLRMSSLGMGCKTKLWYSINEPADEGDMHGKDLLKFMYGDIIEEFVLWAAELTGHTVTGRQGELVGPEGIKGHRDCLIDGVTVDVKTASPFAFEKFRKGGQLLLPGNDPFGYISQMSSYLEAAKDDPNVVEKTKGVFLVVHKVTGEMVLDEYDLTEQVNNKAKEVKDCVDLVAGPKPDFRIDPVPQKKGGDNLKLAMMCEYCYKKHSCWPELRTFQYSNGPAYLVKVVATPRVQEVTINKSDGKEEEGIQI